jgi:hypothetical protein
VSSYIPTLNALINAGEYYETRRREFRLLAVSQPNTPGYSKIVTVELAQIQKRAGNFDVYPLEGAAALVGKVIDGMKQWSWVHLACCLTDQKCVLFT